MLRQHAVWFSALALLASGCSSEPPAPSASAVVAPTADAAVVKSTDQPAPSEANSKPPVEAASNPPDDAAPKDAELAALIPSVDMSDLFAPPQVPLEPREPIPQPVVPELPESPKLEKGLPSIRLIGFMDADRKRALLSIAGKVNVMEEGDAHAGIQLIRIDPPSVTLKPAEEGDEFEINLFDQPWFRQPAPAAGRPGAPRSQRSSPPRTAPVDARSPLPGLNPPPPVNFPAFPAAPAAPPAIPPLSNGRSA